MKSLLICIGIIFFISVAVMVYFMHNAPEGYEDQDGFHYGKEDKK